MTNAIYNKPFTQIVEDTMIECREAAISDATIKAKYKRRVNDVYARIIPTRHEYDWLKKTGSITLLAAYQTGTVAITSGGTDLTGTDTVWTTAMSGRKITIGSNDDVYTFTRTGDTTGTISPAFTGSTDETAASYAIFETDYSLAADYDHMTSEPGLYYNEGRGLSVLDWYPDHIHLSRVSLVPSNDPRYFREKPGSTSMGLRQLEVFPPTISNRIVNYDYIKTFPEMVEFTTGTASTTIGSATVTLSADYSAYISAGQYFRVNPSEVGGDSQWVQITAVSGVTLTVSPTYRSTNTNANYTICDAPDLPPHMTHSLFLGACYLTGLEQNDQSLIGSFSQGFYMALDMGIRREARKRYGKKLMRLDLRDNRHVRIKP